MNEVLSKGLNVNDLISIGDNNRKTHNNRQIYSNNYIQNNREDVLFTKSAKELFGMKYIPINTNN